MPEFLNPFPGLVPRKMSLSELVRALRLDLAAELEAVHLYVSHAEAAEDELAKKVLLDIADEERQHAGEFLALIKRLAPEEAGLLEAGALEVQQMAAEVAGGQAAEEAGQPKGKTDEPTATKRGDAPAAPRSIGSLR
jgi:rubrerythrin